MKKLHETLVGKYVLGYSVVFFSLIISFILSIGSGIYISSQYRKSTAELRLISELETDINLFNNTVGMAYNYISDEALSSYEYSRETLIKKLNESKEKSSERYRRETADMNSTIETFIESSDELIDRIKLCMTDNGSDDVIRNEISEYYLIQQENYSFVSQCFRDEYAMKVKIQNKEDERLRNLQDLIYLMLFILIIILFTITFKYLRGITRSISNSVNALENGIYLMRTDVMNASEIDLKSGDEFEKLSDAFNSMLAIIRQQMIKISEDADIKERLSTAENKYLRLYLTLQKNTLDFLQSRINPHFLFNTLNMIAAQADLEDAQKTEKLIQTTAVYLRYNLDNIKKNVTIKRESENLKDYIYIQKCRYGERFEFILEIAEECLEQIIPCMILQPLVENAVGHGIGMKVSGGKVWIRVYKENDRTVIEAEDNGVGMSEKDIDEFMNALANDEGENNHIGLLNIYKRLNIFFENDVKININNVDPGLLVKLSLPERHDK